MKIRKQVYDLTISDFTDFPVWEFAVDEEGKEENDEATVRPFEYTAPLDPGDGTFVVQAEFLLADGTHMHGYLSPAIQNELAYIQPIIVTENGQVGFWFGIMKPSQELITSSYKSLLKSSAQVFPLAFKSQVDTLGGSIEGIVNGFSFYSRDRKVQFIK
jgi:hypothetical protein